MNDTPSATLKHPDGRWDLKALATSALKKYGLAVDYPDAVVQQVRGIMSRVRPNGSTYEHPEDAKAPWVENLTHLPFISVDNGTLWTEMDAETLANDPEANVSSKDIDQLQYAEMLEDGRIRVMVAVSDVDAFVPQNSPLDHFMNRNTSSVYTPDQVFNLIPPELAEDIVSLNPREERIATVVKFEISANGVVDKSEVASALVKSRVKLDYSSVGAWLEGRAEPSPAMLSQGPELLDNLKLQLKASELLEIAQKRKGAIEFDRTEMRIITERGNAIGLVESQDNVASEIVENFMVTANRVVSEFLRSRGFTTLERVVTPPSRWDKIMQLAKHYGHDLPAEPDAKALSSFLQEEKKKNPEDAEELSFSVIKLIGRGIYTPVTQDQEPPGHFPLGVKNYMQSTASIRRGGDRLSPRMLKAALSGKKAPYSDEELEEFAENLNKKASALKKAERMAEKMIIATILDGQIGQDFDAVITGVKKTKYWCRINKPLIEGSLYSTAKLDVGDKVRVRLSKLDVLQGHIDFQHVGNRKSRT